MARAGRPRKFGVLREANGRISRKATRIDFALQKNRRELSPLNWALGNRRDLPVLETLRREHPIGHLRSRGEITEDEFLAAMVYFASAMAGDAVARLRQELEPVVRRAFSVQLCSEIEAKAFDSRLETCFQAEKISFLEQWSGPSKVRNLTIEAIKRARLPDEANDIRYLRIGLKLLPVMLDLFPGNGS